MIFKSEQALVIESCFCFYGSMYFNKGVSLRMWAFEDVYMRSVHVVSKTTVMPTTHPLQNVVWYNIELLIRFSEHSRLCTKRKKSILPKKKESSFVIIALFNVAMAHGNY